MKGISNEKKLLIEIDTVRGIAITGVLIIHGTSQALVEVPLGSRTYLPYLILNKTSHFSIPTFIFLSGLVLFFQYFHSWNRDQLVPFYKKRFVFLLIPYVLWSVFFYLLNSWTNHIPVQSLSFFDFIRKILSGSVYYHLYFVILIVQYYLLFPCIILVMKKIESRRPHLTLGVVLVSSILIQVTSGVLNNKFEWIADKSILSSTYLTAFCLGGYIGIKYTVYSDWIKHHSKLLLMLTIPFLLGHNALSILNAYGRSTYQALNETIVQCYCILAALCLIEFGKVISSRRLIATFYRKFGVFSFGVYLIHPAVLTFYGMLHHSPPDSIMFHIETFFGLILIFVIPISLVISINMWKYSWLIIGSTTVQRDKGLNLEHD